MKLGRAWIVVAACSLAVSASAQNLKAGLWEVSSKMSSADGHMEDAAADMQAQMAAMPAEQRKMMEEMMAKQGMKLGPGGPGAMTTKVCLTQEMVERNEVPAQEGKCKSTSQPRTGNMMKMSFTCTDPASTGEGVYTIVSPEAYKSAVVVHTTAQGKPETMNMDSTGKWLAADCGSIKPMKAPAGK